MDRKAGIFVRWILWTGRMMMTLGMLCALVVRPDPRLFFGLAALWIVAHDILEFGLEIRMQRVRSWTPGSGRKPRGWKSLGEWDT